MTVVRARACGESDSEVRGTKSPGCEVSLDHTETDGHLVAISRNNSHWEDEGPRLHATRGPLSVLDYLIVTFLLVTVLALTRESPE